MNFTRLLQLRVIDLLQEQIPDLLISSESLSKFHLIIPLGDPTDGLGFHVSLLQFVNPIIFTSFENVKLDEIPKPLIKANLREASINNGIAANSILQIQFVKLYEQLAKFDDSKFIANWLYDDRWNTIDKLDASYRGLIKYMINEIFQLFTERYGIAISIDVDEQIVSGGYKIASLTDLLDSFIKDQKRKLPIDLALIMVMEYAHEKLMHCLCDVIPASLRESMRNAN